MNQSELVANTSDWHQARENACEQVTSGLLSHLIGVEIRASGFNQSQSIVK